MKHHRTQKHIGKSCKVNKMAKTKTHKQRSIKYRGGWVTNTSNFLNNGYMEQHQSTLPTDINKDYHMINALQQPSSNTNMYLVAALATAGVAVGAYVLAK